MIFLPAHSASLTHNFSCLMQSVYFSKSQDAMVLQTWHEKLCSGLISLQLDSLIYVKQRVPEPINESLQLYYVINAFL